ncbi:MAG: AAA family ATPase [Phycisphaerae bacterium]|nr:AAA family ATPase [Phycisphaerae bacterium]
MTRGEDAIEIALPYRCLVVLSGIPGSGKSTFARRRFGPTEIISSDGCRAAICDQVHNQAASRDAFELMHDIIARRMKFDRFSVADATHLTPESRKGLLKLCQRFNYPAYLIVLDVPPEVCKERDAHRRDRRVGSEVIDLHASRFRCDPARYRAEGFQEVWILGTDEADQASVRLEGRGMGGLASDARIGKQ